MSAVDVVASVNVGPTHLAEMFWAMDSEQQADFFAKLDEIAGIQLCFQMAAVVREIQERSDRGDYAAMHGFQTMLSHAQEYRETALDYRVWEARREITRVEGGAA